MKQTSATTAIVCLSVAMWLSGCGGSGGGTSVPVLSNATYAGSYAVACFTASIGGPVRRSVFGTTSPNGLGTAGNTTGTNNNRVLTPAAPRVHSAYSVAFDGSLTIDGSLVGGVASDGGAAVVAQTANTQTPLICVLLRRASTITNATLSGSYHHGTLFASNFGRLSAWTTTAQGAFVFDGAGNTTSPPVSTNAEGMIGPFGIGGMVTYSVNAGGQVVLPTLAGELVGTVSEDGAFAALSGSRVNGETPGIAVFVKYGSAMTNASFRGSYWVVGISTDPLDGNAWASFTGTATADGSGELNYVSITQNKEGVISNPSSVDPYSVSANGTLIAGDRIGAVSQDGKYAFLSGATSTNSTPLLFVFIRK